MQAKLRVSQASDPREQEADRMAEAVGGAGDMGARPPEALRGGLVGRGIISRKSGSIASPQADSSAGSSAISEAAANRIESLRGGSPLPQRERSFFESHMGGDFGNVRIHQGADAGEAADGLNARAFTRGSDIAFASGEYRPESIEGRKLIAHELTHVMQNGGSQAGSGGRNAGVIHRSPRRDSENESPDKKQAGERVPNEELDPDMLVYIVMCYLGIPVGAWRNIADLFLQAIWDSYLERHGDIKKARAAFEEIRLAFHATSTIGKLGMLIEFIGSGKTTFPAGKFSVKIPSKILAKYRARALVILGRFGAKRGMLTVAGQILRKVAFWIDAAFIAGCAMYVYMEKKARQMARMLKSAIDGAVALAHLFRFMVLSPFLLPLQRIQEERHRLSIFNADLSSLDGSPPTRLKGFGIIANLGDAAYDNPANLNKKVGQFGKAKAMIPEFYSGVQGLNEQSAVGALILKSGGKILTLGPPQRQFAMKVRSYSRHLEAGRILKYRQSPAKLAAAEVNEILKGR
ncbi:MAG: DUF4157 domain-containing protein [bacterium]|nr:DUF4157 domain-containing protein [bacterium]